MKAFSKLTAILPRICFTSNTDAEIPQVSGLAALVAAIGFLILATTTGTVPRYFATFLAVNIFVSVAITLAWSSSLHATESKRAGGLVSLNTLSQKRTRILTTLPDNPSNNRPMRPCLRNQHLPSFRSAVL